MKHLNIFLFFSILVFFLNSNPSVKAWNIDGGGELHVNEKEQEQNGAIRYPSSRESPAEKEKSRYQIKKEELQQLRDEKLQQFQLDAIDAGTEIDIDYTKIIYYVNANQTPTNNELNEIQKAIMKNNRYLTVLDDSQKSVYRIMSAWVYYFDHKNDNALKQAETGQKMSPLNSNAVKTRLALSLLCKDYTTMMAMPKETAGSNTTGRIPQTTQAENGIPSMPGLQAPSFTSASSTMKGELMLDVNAMRIELIGQTFDSNFSPLDSNLHGRLLCAMLWKIDSAELDRFLQVTPKKDPNEPNTQNPTSLPTSRQEQNQSSTDGQTKQTTAFDDFAKLQTVFTKDKRIAFVSINFNDRTKKTNIMNWLKKNPQKWQTVFPVSYQSVLYSVSENLDEPILLIVAPDSTIRYAGRVNGFLPQMIINAILNISEDVNKTDANLPVVEYKQPIVEQKPNQQTAEKVVLPPLQDSNNIQTATTPTATVKQDDAEKLLANAREFFRMSNVSLSPILYQRPIELCRQVIKDYPKTKYETEAQMLLHKVPERFRQRFNLTDHELGL
ncbi:MAG: hypothetical protein ACYC54_15275 [Sedimentisphaerales bacterium]